MGIAILIAVCVLLAVLLLLNRLVMHGLEEDIDQQAEVIEGLETRLSTLSLEIKKIEQRQGEINRYLQDNMLSHEAQIDFLNDWRNDAMRLFKLIEQELEALGAKLSLSKKMELLFHYYNVTRGIGHTMLMVHGAERVRGALIVVSDERVAYNLKRFCPDAKFITLSMGWSDIQEMLSGERAPLIIDNSAMMEILRAFTSMEKENDCE
jgi:hypothetical protein